MGVDAHRRDEAANSVDLAARGAGRQLFGHGDDASARNAYVAMKQVTGCGDVGIAHDRVETGFHQTIFSNRLPQPRTRRVSTPQTRSAFQTAVLMVS